MSPFLFVVSLLATGGGGRGGRGRELAKGVKTAMDTRKASSSSKPRTSHGRKRYARDGTKRKPSSASDPSSDATRWRDEIRPLPPLTVPGGPMATYFSCRHNYEGALMHEIQRKARMAGGTAKFSSPYPGLVRVEDCGDALPDMYDPVYALQILPRCVVVKAESIKGIAKEVVASLLGADNDVVPDAESEARRQRLRAAARGSLTIQPLVPGMCKGQARPILKRRAEKIGEEMERMLAKGYPAARRAPIASDSGSRPEQPIERWALQVMLQSPVVAVASLEECQRIGPGGGGLWPDATRPLGIAAVDIEERVPSSAYRKLMEGIECLGNGPMPGATVVDLGACPGGWTYVMRRYFDSHVVAVDRSELDRSLMQDPMVEFVQGDAFAFEPTGPGSGRWMISDVVAYPERITDLLDQWCENEWASVMIVTMKFQGDDPDFDELERAVQVVKGHGYNCRVKHFFNNKNEVTFMVSMDNMAGAGGFLPPPWRKALIGH
ncbi:hypothetical protein ACHAWF_018507 [Thalassiosira exigua]